MTEPFRLQDYLSHILDAIDRIDEYTSNLGEEKFLSNMLIQDAVIRNIEIIGEASNNILKRYAEFAKKYSEVAWFDIYSMRNRISHGYFSVDLEIVWNTIQKDLPFLKTQIIRIISEITKNT